MNAREISGPRLHFGLELKAPDMEASEYGVDVPAACIRPLPFASPQAKAVQLAQQRLVLSFFLLFFFLFFFQKNTDPFFLFCTMS